MGIEIDVDRHLCIGSATCVRLAPGAFALDDDEIAMVQDASGVGADKLRLAAGACAPGAPLIAAIETARGLLAASEMATASGVRRQIPVLHDVFSPDDDEVAWARAVIDAFTAGGGEPLRLESGEFVDVPVADRARRVLALAAASDPDRS